jgi:pilus assembly protein Flp/PilA
MTKLFAMFQRFGKDESGQGLVEYVLIIALVAIGLILALTVFRNRIGQTFDNVNSTLANAPSTPFSPAAS